MVASVKNKRNRGAISGILNFELFMGVLAKVYMITSFTVDSFWGSYATLALNYKKAAKKAYTLWIDNPFHPSLKFKCINVNQNIWPARILLGYRALCIFENSSAVWF